MYYYSELHKKYKIFANNLFKKHKKTMSTIMKMVIKCKKFTIISMICCNDGVENDNNIHKCVV